MQVVIDKSYLQGAPLQEFRRLCDKHTPLFTETLLYELLTTEKAKIRKVCFSKLLAADDRIVLIPRTGPLFRYEIEHQLPASPLIAHGCDRSIPKPYAASCSC